MTSISKIKQIFAERDDFVLVTHVDPDGDAIGSLVSLGAALKPQGKNVSLVVRDMIPSVFDFLVEGIEIVHDWPEKIGTIILLDNGDFRRTGFQPEIVKAKKLGAKIINIDHHPKNDLWRFVTVNHAIETASSTSEVLYRLFIELGFEITAEIATALMAGIFYDTGGFQHQNTSQEVLDIAADLLRKGAKLKKITTKMVNDRSIALFKLWGIALDRIFINEKYGISVSVLTQADLAVAQASEDDISGLIGLLNTTKESRAALLLYETADGKIKGSLRTENDEVNLTKLAGVIGGGGHKKAAGFTIGGKIIKNQNGWQII